MGGFKNTKIKSKTANTIYTKALKKYTYEKTFTKFCLEGNDADMGVEGWRGSHGS